MMGLTNKIAVVTGGAAGIGAFICRALSRETMQRPAFTKALAAICVATASIAQ
jgi:NAD(P)-dependent dehydrogenase (short-subunit alcohol dehydrogenase family)